MAFAIITGGARGVDLEAEKLARRYGLPRFVLIPPCHPRTASIAPLTYPQLVEAIPLTTQVAWRLGKKLSSPISQQYIYRNYHIVNEADRVLAFMCLSPTTHMCPGGTGWAVEMAKVLQKDLYVYDVESGVWWWYNAYQNKFVACGPEQYPLLMQKTSVIGMRNIDDYPKALLALQETFHRSLTQDTGV